MPPLTATPIWPVYAAQGTTATSCVALALVTLAATPLKVTTLFPGAGSKPLPVMVMAVPTLPEVGLNPVIDGPCAVKLEVVLTTVPPLTLIPIGPVVTP